MEADVSGAAWFVEIGSGSMKWRLPMPGQEGDVQSDVSPLGRFSRHSRPLDLAGGLGRTDRLSERALGDLDTALAELAAEVAGRRLAPPQVVGTEVLRRAGGDQEAVSAMVAKHLGSNLRVLSVDEEAGLSLLAASTESTTGDITIMDLGAASTELATAAVTTSGSPGAGSVSSFSIPLGGRTIAADYLESDPPDPRDLSAALSVIELHLDDLRREHPDLAEAISSGTVVGLGAFVQVAAVEIGVDISSGSGPVDGYVLEHEAAEEIFRVLATESRSDRLHNPGLLPVHVDGVVGALCLVVEFFRQFGIDSIKISTVGPVDGLVVGDIVGDAKIGL